MDDIKCEVVRDLLPAFAEGILRNGTRETIEEHLQKCELCRKEYEDIKREVVLVNVTIEQPKLPGRFRRNRMQQEVVAWGIVVLGMSFVIGMMRLFMSDNQNFDAVISIYSLLGMYFVFMLGSMVYGAVKEKHQIKVVVVLGVLNSLIPVLLQHDRIEAGQFLVGFAPVLLGMALGVLIRKIRQAKDTE